MGKNIIFVLDHGHEIKDFLSSHISKEMFEIHHFNSGDRALEVIKEIKPELIFLAEEMLDMKATGFMTKFSEHLLFQNDHPIFLVAPDDLPECEKMIFMSLGIEYFIPSPLNADDLFKAIEYSANQSVKKAA